MGQSAPHRGRLWKSEQERRRMYEGESAAGRRTVLQMHAEQRLHISKPGAVCKRHRCAAERDAPRGNLYTCEQCFTEASAELGIPWTATYLGSEKRPQRDAGLPSIGRAGNLRPVGAQGTFRD